MERDKSAILVTGDPARNKELCVPGGGFATIKIALPKAWDSLMADRGYRPLSDFMLNSDIKSDIPAAKSRRVPTHSGARGDRPQGLRSEYPRRQPGRQRRNP